MRNVWLVVKHDIGVTLRQRSFWIMTLIMPALLLGMIALDVREEVGENIAAGSNETAAETAIPVIGLVDEARLIKTIPTDIPQNMFRPYANIALAEEAMKAGEIEQAVLLPQDYIASGKVTIYDENFVIRENGQGMGVAFNGGQEWMLHRLIAANLIEDEQLQQALQNPLQWPNTKTHIIAPNEQVNTEGNTMARVITIGLPYILYFLLLMGSSYLLRSVTAEKENRTVELLLLRLDPRELMFGKIIAVSAVLSIQVGVLVGCALFALGRSADLLAAPAFIFPPRIFSVGWTIRAFWLFVICLGYGRCRRPVTECSGGDAHDLVAHYASAPDAVIRHSVLGEPASFTGCCSKSFPLQRTECDGYQDGCWPGSSLANLRQSGRFGYHNLLLYRSSRAVLPCRQFII